MKKINTSFAWLFVTVIALNSCSIIRPGEIGFRQRLGTIKGENILSGVRFYNPFVTKIIKMNTRTVEIFDKLPLPTKEGLSVVAEISLLYHINPDSVTSIYKRFGMNYQKVIVLSNFWATAREISARFGAKELYATERIKIENAMMDELSRNISSYGFVVDAILLKDIDLPPQMANAIQEKVNAEQAVLQMEFVIQKQQKEAERMIIEAEGIKKAQEIINSTLTENQLRYNQIEMLKGLINSPNTKVIITDSKNPQVMIPQP
ncbi:MAG: prohibitin family protein [Bacteroidota bacterium]